ncbi:MAG: DUF3822 family protein [Prevotella sp.]|nr:DUF3822 family protein [Prevotella sp.]
MAEPLRPKQQLTIRIGRNTLSFAMPDGEDGEIIYEPYVVKSGMSMAANLREAFKTADLLASPPPRVRVVLDSDVLLVPVDVFSESTMGDMMTHAFPQTAADAVYYNVLPDLNAVAVFAMNRDLRLVVDDHFRDVQLIAAVTPVWRHLHQRSYTGIRHKLFGYFHEQHLDVFSFSQNRFKFSNNFEASHAHDCLYFLLYVWKQLQLQAEYDELHLVGDIPEPTWILTELKRFVQNAYVINPAADFTSLAAATVKGLPYDLQTLFVRGR